MAAVHPGLVKSQLSGRAQTPIVIKTIIGAYAALGGRIDADTGSWTSVFCAASPEMRKDQSGTYFQRIAEAGWQSSLAKDMALAAKLEEWTRETMRTEGWIE